MLFIGFTLLFTSVAPSLTSADRPLCTYTSCDVCLPTNRTVNLTNLSLPGPDGLLYMSPLRIGRAVQNWDTQSVMATILGILVKEQIGIDVQYVDCLDAVQCHLGILSCGGWQNYSCTRFGTSEAALRLFNSSAKRFPDPLPDVFVNLESWPIASLQEALGVDNQTWQNRESVELGPTGYLSQDGLYVLPAAISRAWDQSEVTLEVYRTYNITGAATPFLATPRQITQMGIGTNAQGCPGTATVSKSVQVRMAALLAKGYVCQSSWWLTPSCASLGAAWWDTCTAVLDDDWGNQKPEIDRALAYSGMQMAKIVLDYDSFNATLFSGIDYVAFLLNSTADARFQSLGAGRVRLRKDLEATKRISTKLVWQAVPGSSRNLQILLQQMTVNRPKLTSIISLMVNASSNGFGPTERASPGFLQKVTCDWLLENNETWTPWMPGKHTCSAGEVYDELQLRCAQCPAGKAEIKSVCEICPSGKFTAQPGSTACSLCSKGFFQPEAGKNKCFSCNQSYYQESEGAVNCTACPQTFTTSLQGASSLDQCLCPPLTYWRPKSNTSGICVPCLQGTTCPGGREIPTQNPGFWTDTLDKNTREYSVYRCRNVKECPAGPPGTCASGREGRACNECQNFHYRKKSGDCPVCEPKDTIPFVFAILFAIFFGAVAVRLLMSDYSRQQLAKVSLGIVASQAVTNFQVVQVLSQLSISWFEPAKSFIELISSINFDFEVLNSSCVIGSTNLIVKAVMTLLIYPFLFACIYFGYLLSKLRGSPVPWEVVFNVTGTVFLVLFVTLTVALLMPLQCISSPNGKMTVMANPGIICWNTRESDHSVLTFLSILGMLMYPVSFLSFAFWQTLQYPHRLQSGRGLRENQKYFFLFGRFKPEAYYFGVMYICRSLTISLIPIIFANTATLQTLSMTCVFFVFSALQVANLPWRTALGNFADWISSFCIIVVLEAVGPMQQVPDRNIPGLASFTLILSLFFCICGFLCYTLYFRLRKPQKYGLFLCHHKAGAGVLSRFIKVIVAKHSPVQVFIDSDQLQDLDHLFDIVRCSTKNLVVIFSPELLYRSWCAGEIVTAYRNKINTVPLVCPGFSQPDAKGLDTITASWSAEQKNTLGRFGITMDMVIEAYLHLRDLPILSMPRFETIGIQEKTIADLMDACRVPRRFLSQVDEITDHASICVTGNVTDVEVLSACYVIGTLLQHSLQESVETITSVEHFSEGPSAAYLIVLLSKGLLRNPSFAQILLEMQANEVELIVVNAEMGFDFPGSDFYSDIEANGLGAPPFGPEQGLALAKAYRALMKVIALPLSPLGSARLLSTQVSEIKRRIRPDKIEDARSKSFDTRGFTQDLSKNSSLSKKLSSILPLSERSTKHSV